MSWFEKLMPSRIRIDSSKDKKVIPEGVWEKCLSCQTVLYREDIVSNQYVCTNCGYHMRIKARERLDIFLDPDEKKELFSKLSSKYPFSLLVGAKFLSNFRNLAKFP